MKPSLSRRGFLKLIGATSLFCLNGSDQLARSVNNKGSTNQNQPNFLILIFDAFSASNASLYGYPRNTTPNLERFAQQATVYHRHYAGGNFTSPGTASLLTGTYPWTHRAFQLLSTIDNVALQTNLFLPNLDGYHTFAYTHNPLTFVQLNQLRGSIEQLTPISDLCRADTSFADKLFARDSTIAFEAETLLLRNKTYPPASLLLSPLDAAHRYSLRKWLKQEYQIHFPNEISRFSYESAPAFMYFKLEDGIDWLIGQLNKMPQPFLGYIHFLPPHHPYIARREFIGRFQDNWQPISKPDHFFSQGFSQDYLNDERRLYDEMIAYVDSEFGRFYDAAIASKLSKNTHLFVTSDHGEMFERGIFTHNTPTLYEPIIRVPLIYSQPDQSSRQDVFSPTSNVDLLPTVLTEAGMSVPTFSEGQSLSKQNKKDAGDARPIYSVEAKQNPRYSPIKKGTVALIKDDFKLIYTFGYPGLPEAFELYDLHEDPEELKNIFSETDPNSRALKDELLTKISEVNSG